MDLDQKEWSSQLNADNNAVILDVRTPEEYQEGMIPGAINYDIYMGQEFINAVDNLDKSRNYYVYCKAGARSAQACTIMSSLGFKTTHNLLGGFSQWKGDVEIPG